MEVGEKEMVDFVDSIIGILVIVIFFYLILTRMMKRNPRMREILGEFFPYLKQEEPVTSIDPLGETRQVWQEKRTIL